MCVILMGNTLQVFENEHSSRDVFGLVGIIGLAGQLIHAPCWLQLQQEH